MSKWHYEGMAGAPGILANVIKQAALDLKSLDQWERADAQAYFASDLYRHHMQSLGQDPSKLPLNFREVNMAKATKALEQAVNKTSTIISDLDQIEADLMVNTRRLGEAIVDDRPEVEELQHEVSRLTGLREALKSALGIARDREAEAKAKAEEARRLELIQEATAAYSIAHEQAERVQEYLDGLPAVVDAFDGAFDQARERVRRISDGEYRRTRLDLGYVESQLFFVRQLADQVKAWRST